MRHQQIVGKDVEEWNGGKEIFSNTTQHITNSLPLVYSENIYSKVAVILMKLGYKWKVY